MPRQDRNLKEKKNKLQTAALKCQKLDNFVKKPRLDVQLTNNHTLNDQQSQVQSTSLSNSSK